MKQTAVEWLIKEFSAILGPIKTEPMQDMLLGDAFKKAKAMEKEQIKHAYDWGETNASDECNGDGPTHDNFEQYYNETYKP
jgi:hypothetical protein